MSLWTPRNTGHLTLLKYAFSVQSLRTKSGQQRYGAVDGLSRLYGHPAEYVSHGYICHCYLGHHCLFRDIRQDKLSMAAVNCHCRDIRCWKRHSCGRSSTRWCSFLCILSSWDHLCASSIVVFLVGFFILDLPISTMVHSSPNNTDP